MSEKIRILYVVNHMVVGGIENFLMNIIRNIDLGKYDIEFLYCDGKDTYYDEEIRSYGIKITGITSRSRNLFKHLSELKHFFSRNKFDVVHINYSNATCFTAARAAKKAGVKKIIVHSHSSNASNPVVHKLCKPLLCHYANMFFACSQLAADWMFTRNVAKSKVHIIRNAVNTKEFLFSEDKRTTVRNEFDIGDRFVIGHIGRMTDTKNHKFLLNVFNEYHKNDPNSMLLLVGDGELRDEIKRQAQKLEISDSVIFTGIRDDVPELLCAMDCFVMPSYYEGLPVTLVEAQAAGVRTFVSDTITHEVDLTDLISYVSLELQDKEWAMRLNGNVHERAHYNSIIADSGFDMRNELTIIERLYSL